MRVIIKRAIEKTNHRKTRGMREHIACRRLKTGEAVLFFNRNHRICTLIDSSGGVHRYWSDDGTEFDTSAIRKLMKSGLYVELAAYRLKAAVARKAA